MLKTNRKLIIYNPPNFQRYNSITNLDLVHLGNFFNFSTKIFVAFSSLKKSTALFMAEEERVN